jgi:hypothetical protein
VHDAGWYENVLSGAQDLPAVTELKSQFALIYVMKLVNNVFVVAGVEVFFRRGDYATPRYDRLHGIARCRQVYIVQYAATILHKNTSEKHSACCILLKINNLCR